jgi:hypothetical protein
MVPSTATGFEHQEVNLEKMVRMSVFMVLIPLD